MPRSTICEERLGLRRRHGGTAARRERPRRRARAPASSTADAPPHDRHTSPPRAGIDARRLALRARPAAHDAPLEVERVAHRREQREPGARELAARVRRRRGRARRAARPARATPRAPASAAGTGGAPSAGPRPPRRAPRGCRATPARVRTMRDSLSVASSRALVLEQHRDGVHRLERAADATRPLAGAAHDRAQLARLLGHERRDDVASPNSTVRTTSASLSMRFTP